MTTVVNVHDAKTHLSRLLEQALRGEEVVIARAGKPLVRLTPVEPVTTPRRVPGRLAHLLPAGLGDAVLEPLTPEELAEWEEGPIFPPDEDERGQP